MIKISNIKYPLLIIVFLSGCVTTQKNTTNKVSSYLEGHQSPTLNLNEEQASEKQDEIEAINDYGFSYVEGISPKAKVNKKEIDVSLLFSDSSFVKITADGLALKDYLHYVMGDLLGVSYILDNSAESDSQTITLSIQEKISKRQLFILSEKLLLEKGYQVKLDDGLYYIHAQSDNQVNPNLVYSYGRDANKVPETSQTIVHIAPFIYGMETPFAMTMNQIAQVEAAPNFEKNALIIKGKRRQVIKALEFMDLLDTAGFTQRSIGIYKAIYTSTKELKQQISEMLLQEGITVSAKDRNDKAVSIITLPRTGDLVLFAHSDNVLQRVKFWAEKIDQPSSGNALEYYVYVPQFARATDIGQSLSAILGSGYRESSNKTSANTENEKIRDSNNRNSMVVSNENVKLVIDERANSIILYTTGDEYRKIRPLIHRLDILPRQVILEVMIAEVTLTDEFSQGVEFALSNSGAAKKGGYNLNVGSTGLSYVLSGANGKLDVSLFQKNSNVNILSRPSLVVRDGVSANINIGNDIPTVGETITDPINGTRASVVYRKTGVELEVTPTINARGIVIMDIKQKSSDQADAGESVAGSPIIFERSITTEVIAQTGQTIILGGLMSEKRTLNDRSVPFFSSIPIIGNLFDSTSDSATKTELVVLVTPRVIENSDEWEVLKNQFRQITPNLSY